MLYAWLKSKIGESSNGLKFENTSKKITEIKFQNVIKANFVQAESLKDALDCTLEQNNLIILTGQNAIGKTHLLTYIKNCIDHENQKNNFTDRIIYKHMLHKNNIQIKINILSNSINTSDQKLKNRYNHDVSISKQNSQNSSLDLNDISFIRDIIKLENNTALINQDTERHNISMNSYVENKVRDKVDKINERIRSIFSKDFQLAFEKNGNVSLQKKIKKQWQDCEPSSGEHTLLIYALLCFGDLNKMDVLLLDEPDRHLEPKLVEKFFKIINDEFVNKNVQVIMTTNRPDTIALAPNGSIYKIDKNKNGQIFISPCDKLRALFKLTYNLRAIVNFKIRVFVEALIESRFYETIYRVLYQYSSFVRDQYDDKKWPYMDFSQYDELKDCNNRILSRRYQLDFFPVSLYKELGDDGDKVIDRAINDLNTINFSTQYLNYNELSPLKKLKSFGIIDANFENDDNIQLNRHYKLNKRTDQNDLSSLVKNQIEQTLRYNVNNYLYDPILFCSFFNSETEFTKILTDAGFDLQSSDFKTISDLIKNIIKNLKPNLQESDCKNSARDYFKHLIRAILTQTNIYQRTKLFEQLSDNSSLFFQNETISNNIDWKKLKTTLNRTNISIQDRIPPELDQLIESLLAHSQTVKYFSYQIVHVSIDPEIEHTPLEINYPVFLLKLNGHNIEDAIPFFKTKYNHKNLYDHVLEKLLKYRFGHGHIYIPFDLFSIFIRLNQKARQQFKT